MSNKLSIKWVSVVWLAALALLVTPVIARTTPSFPLGEPGPYAVGVRTVKFTDPDRNDREMNNTVWYPAIIPENANRLQEDTARKLGWVNAEPDLQAGPASLIIASHGLNADAIDFAPISLILVSHGFVVVGLQHPQDNSPLSFVNRPMDALFVLEQLTAINQSSFGDLIDTDHVGIMGDSYGAYTTLALTGARIDPAAASARTAKPITTTRFSDTDPRFLWPDWDWDAVAAYHARFSPVKSGELWQPYTDKRILAAAMDSPCFVPMFGEQGLAAATVPTFIVAGTNDDVCLYEPDSAFAFAHLGSHDRHLLSIVNGGHVPHLFYGALPITLTAHLYTAFFEKYLRNQDDNAKYLTAEYIEGVESQLKIGLVWGYYTKQ